jgi:acyl dehydratase
MENINLKKFRVGQKAISPGRTITEADIVLFAGISGDWTELHTNAEYMKKAYLDRE